MEVLILDTNLGQDLLVEVMNLSSIYIYYLGILVCRLDPGGHHQKHPRRGSVHTLYMSIGKSNALRCIWCHMSTLLCTWVLHLCTLQLLGKSYMEGANSSSSICNSMGVVYTPPLGYPEYMYLMMYDVRWSLGNVPRVLRCTMVIMYYQKNE